jgi:murein L,D-transpeptidase YcbB/YkuD
MAYALHNNQSERDAYLEPPIHNTTDVRRLRQRIPVRKGGNNDMKYKLLTTSLVLWGSLGLGVNSASSQSTPKSSGPEANSPGTSQAEQPGSGPLKSPHVSGMEKQKTQRAMDLSLEEIKQIQQALKEKGHEPGSAKGVMNAETRDALREFQKANNLPVTGTVDKATAQKLGVSISGSAGTTNVPRSQHESLPGRGTAGSPDIGSGSSRSRSTNQ